MSGFFEPPPPVAEPEVEPDLPEWFQPPDDELAALVPVRRRLATSDRLAIVLSHVDVHRASCSLRLHVVVRRSARMSRPFAEQPREGEPVLTQHGGGGSGGDRMITVSSSLWLWPLPPAEPFDLVVAWPLLDVPDTFVELDGAQIVAAAGRVSPLFADDG